MAIATTPTTQLDELLDRIGVKLQLTQTAYDLAAARYKTIAAWLRADGSPLARYKLEIYPQGSLRIGTTLKLPGRKEFDLDFVCEFQVHPSLFPDPIKLLDMIETRLRANATYKGMIERKNRCIRVSYADEFYMDILPGCPSPSICLYGEHCLVVPDSDADDWKPSNPKGYALWYESQAQEAIRKFGKAIQPLPDQQPYDELATLNRVVQLIKRRRDMHFEKERGKAPISIVLTTLAAQNYLGSLSVSDAMATVLSGIVRTIPDVAQRRLQVKNPTNPNEDLSERWDADPESYLAFISWIRKFNAEWISLANLNGVQNVKTVLERMFGERIAKEAIEEHLKSYSQPRQSAQLGVERGTGLITTTGASSTTIPRNNFFGGN